MALVISVANQKGGVAKTTTCANLGSGLALRNINTLLIDFDPQGSLTHFFGFPPHDPSVAKVGDWLQDRRTADDVIRPTAYENLSLIAANDDLKGIERVMQDDMVKAFRFLQRKVDSIRDRFDVILIDTLPSFSLLFVNSLAAGDVVLVPAKLEFLSMQGIGLLMSKIRDVHEHVKPIQGVGIVGTFHRKGVTECERCLEELRNGPLGVVFKSTVHLNSKLAESAAFMKPIQHYDKTSQGYQDYERLTEEVIETCQIKPRAAAL